MALNLGLLLALVLFSIALASLLSPLESLTWWAGWFGTEEDLDELMINPDSEAIAGPTPRAYIIYLTGIGGFSEKSFLPREQHFLDQLEVAIPGVVVVDDIYPYSVTNNGLVDNRTFSGFWRWTVKMKEKGSPLGFLVNVRNVMQVLVAADNRYGPIYARGVAEVVVNGLRRHNYRFGSGTPVYLLGYSGGGEMAISAAGPLKESLNAPVTVISLGGVVSNDPNVREIDHLYHLYGEKDRVHIMGPILFPGRWKILRSSNWNRARSEGKITFMPMGPMAHNGPGGYLDEDSAQQDGRNNLQTTIDTVHSLLRDNENRITQTISDYPSSTDIQGAVTSS